MQALKANGPPKIRRAVNSLAGPVRFELTMGFPTPVFKTGAFNRSATDPGCLQAKFYQLASLFGGRGRRGPPAARARNGLAPPLPAGR